MTQKLTNGCPTLVPPGVGGTGWGVRFFLQRPWRLWLAQFVTIVRMELRKNFFSARGIGVYLLAFAPAVIIGLHAFIDGPRARKEDTQILAGIFQFYYLRLAIFFGCMGIFTRLFRGEMIERSLHYYLLAPVRRELLVIGKFVAGAITSIAFFGVAVSASFLLMYSNMGPAGPAFIFGPGSRHLTAYLAITVLACLAYGAVFLALSLVLKNPIIPGMLLMGWEAINPLLPAMMQKASIIFYLRHLLPVKISPDGIFALLTIVTEPVPAWAAVSGVIFLTLLVLIFACFRVRRLEISYTTD